MFTIIDLATYLRRSNSEVKAAAQELGLVRWNYRKTRMRPLTDVQAKAVIAAIRVGKKALSGRL